MTSGPTSDADASTHGLRRVVNRWLSPDHIVGQSLLVARMRTQLALWRPATADERQLKATIDALAPAFTMMDLTRLRQLARLAHLVVQEKVAGAIVECGTWRGGGIALIDKVMRDAGDPRPLWGFDSFEGLPAPGERDADEVHQAFFIGWCTASEADVNRALRIVGGDVGHLHLVRGWLSETLPSAATGPIAFLNIDVDWYDSVKMALDVLVDRVVAGGVINIDDYGRWRGCDEAVRDFFAQRSLPLTLLQRTGNQGAWFRKP